MSHQPTSRIERREEPKLRTGSIIRTQRLSGAHLLIHLDALVDLITSKLTERKGPPDALNSTGMPPSQRRDSHVMLSKPHVASDHEQANIIDRIVDQSEPHTVPNVHRDQDDEAAATTLPLDGTNGAILGGINATIPDGINQHSP